MSVLAILMKKDARELIRSKKALILGIIFILFGLTSSLLAYYTPELIKSLGGTMQVQMPKPTILDSYDQLTKNFSGLVTYILIVIFSGEIANERMRGQLTTLMNNNVRKAQFIASKVITQVIFTALAFVVAVCAFAFYNAILFNKALAEHSVLSLATLLVYLFFIIALVNFFGSFAKNTAVTMVASFVVTIFIAVFNLFKFGKYMPNYLITLSVNVIRGHNIMNAVQTIWVTVGLTLVLIIASLIICRNKD